MMNVTAPYTDTTSTICSIILTISSIAVWIALSFTQKRTNKALNICNGLPSIVFAINFLNPRHRVVYMLACGGMTSQILGLIIGVNLKVDNKWAGSIVHILVVILLVTVVIINTYPILACVEAPIPLIGYILGAIYCDLYFIVLIILFAKNSEAANNLPLNYRAVYSSQIVLMNTPTTICLIGIIIWYHYKLFKELLRVYRTGTQWKAAILQQPQTQVHNRYVKQLLSPYEPWKTTFLDKYIYTRTRLPLPVLIIGVVSSIAIIQLLVRAAFLFPYIYNLVGDWLDTIHQQSPNTAYIKRVASFFHSLTAITVLSPICATFLYFGLFAHYIYTIRVYINEYHAGKHENYKTIKFPAFTLSSSIRYAGYQIAAFIAGWAVHTAVIFFILLAIMLLFYFPSEVGFLYYEIAIVAFWAVLLIVIQLVISKFVFITEDSNEWRTVIIENQRAFSLFSYILLIYNIATGLMVAALRIGLSFLSMVLVLPRMDKLLFLKDFEMFDLSHTMFKNFMIMEALMQNSIVHEFVNLMKQSIQQKTPSFVEKRAVVSVRARNRWFVAYTLINNPNLRNL